MNCSQASSFSLSKQCSYHCTSNRCSAHDISAKKGTKSERAREVGATIAKAMIEKGITACIFDRGGYLYHGRVKALAEGAREAGLAF